MKPAVEPVENYCAFTTFGRACRIVVSFGSGHFPRHCAWHRAWLRMEKAGTDPYEEFCDWLPDFLSVYPQLQRSKIWGCSPPDVWKILTGDPAPSLDTAPEPMADLGLADDDFFLRQAVRRFIKREGLLYDLVLEEFYKGDLLPQDPEFERLNLFLANIPEPVRQELPSSRVEKQEPEQPEIQVADDDQEGPPEKAVETAEVTKTGSGDKELPFDP